MTIPAVRFKSLVEEFNVASTSFAAVMEDGVLNSPEVADAVDSAKGLLDQIKNADVVELAQDTLASVTRVTQDVFGTFTDLAKMSENALTGIVDDILPGANSATKSLLKGMVKTCRNDALGRAAGLGGNFALPKCDGFGMGIGKCPPNMSASLLNKITGANLNEVKSLLGNMLKKIVALGGLGFGANLCGTFAAITQGLTDKNVLMGAAGILLNQEGLRGNIQAVFDISKSLNNFPILSDFPRTLSNIAGNFKNPLGAVQNGLSALAGMTTGAFGAIDEAWNVAEDGMSSVADLGEISDDLSDVFAAGAMDQSLDITSLDVPQSFEDAPEFYTSIESNLVQASPEEAQAMFEAIPDNARTSDLVPMSQEDATAMFADAADTPFEYSAFV